MKIFSKLFLKYFYYLPFLCLFVACASDSEEVRLLKEKLKKQEELLKMRSDSNKELNSLMLDVNSSLDSINIYQDELDSLILEGNDKESILAKISKIDNFVKESNGKIENLEKQLLVAKKNGATEVEGLQRLVNQLKAELRTKEAQIAILEEKVQDLEHNVTALRNEVKTKEKIIKVTKQEANDAEEEARLAEEKRQKDRETNEKKLVQQKLKSLYEQANTLLLNAPKTKKPRRWEIYKEAHDKYKQALSFYNNNIKYVGDMNISKSQLEQGIRETSQAIPDRVKKREKWSF